MKNKILWATVLIAFVLAIVAGEYIDKYPIPSFILFILSMTYVIIFYIVNRKRGVKDGTRKNIRK